VVDANNSNQDLITEKKHVSELDFDYEVTGKTSFTPLRVYNDGIRTIIQMDESISNTDLPSLLVLDARNKENLVNYRVINNRFIVDQVFSKAILIAGVGRDKQKVTIARINNRSNETYSFSEDDGA
jgi:type IV secretion system protein VirB9